MAPTPPTAVSCVVLMTFAPLRYCRVADTPVVRYAVRPVVVVPAYDVVVSVPDVKIDQTAVLLL